MEVLALAGYRAQEEDELSLALGDVVRQEIPEALCGTETQKPRCARRQSHPGKFQGPQRWCKVNFNYIPEQADELKLQAGEIVEVIKEIEDGWWLGKKNQQLGAFPSNFVELLDSGPPSLDNQDMPSISPGPQKPPKLSSLTYDSPPDYLQTVSCPETCRVLFDYQPEAPDELALRKGDEVKVLRKTTEDKGWWEGECQGRRGVFPDNFVLPPPPVKKLVSRKVISRESVAVKEQKKLVSRTSLPTVKKLVTAASGPSKAKTPWTPSGDYQKCPSGDSGSNGNFPSGAPGQPGRKRSRTKAPQQRSASCQEEAQRGRAKAPSGNKTPTLKKTTTPEKIRPLHKAPSSEKIPSADKVPTPQKTLTLQNKVTGPEKILAPALGAPKDDAPGPKMAPQGYKDPSPQKTLTLQNKATGPEEIPAPPLEAPSEEEALDPKMAPQRHKAPIPEKALTTEQALSEEVASLGDCTQFHHFSPEEDPQRAKSPVATEAQPQEEAPMPGEQSSLEECFCMMELPHVGMLPQFPKPREQESSLLQSMSEPGSTSALQKAHPQKAATLPGTSLGQETVPKEEMPLEEEVSPREELTSQGVAPKEQVSPEEVHPFSQAPHTHKQTPDPQETPTLHSLVLQNSERKSDRVDLTLKEELGSLRRSLELLGLELEKKMTEVWEELRNEKEKRRLLEVQLMQRTQNSPSQGFKHAQTQTQ